MLPEVPQCQDRIKSPVDHTNSAVGKCLICGSINHQTRVILSLFDAVILSDINFRVELSRFPIMHLIIHTRYSHIDFIMQDGIIHSISFHPLSFSLFLMYFFLYLFLLIYVVYMPLIRALIILYAPPFSHRYHHYHSPASSMNFLFFLYF